MLLIYFIKSDSGHPFMEVLMAGFDLYDEERDVIKPLLPVRGARREAW